MKKAPNPPGSKNQSEERYEVPFEEEKARQDKADQIPDLDSAAYHGLVGSIALKVGEKTEADSRGVLGALLVGCGSIIGRNTCLKVADTKHYCNEFLCLVGQTAQARKGMTTDIVEAILRLSDSVWREGCIARNLSTGEGLIKLVRDDVIKRQKVKSKDKQKPSEDETTVVIEGVRDKRKLCFLSEFGEQLTVMSRDGNTLSHLLRIAWDGNKKLESNTKNEPVYATDAHISIMGNITKGELLKLLPALPGYDGFANRFLWLLIERTQWIPDGGPSVESYLVQEIQELAKRLRVARGRIEIHRSAAAVEFWKNLYVSLSKTAADRAVVDRAEAHTLRLSMLYALLAGRAEVDVEHIEAAYALWRYNEAGTLGLFGVGELCKEAHLTLDYLRAKGSEGATRTEIQNRLFHNHRTGAEIHGWLRALKEKQLAYYETEKNDNGNVIERWFAIQCSGPSPDKPPQPPKEAQKKNKTKPSSAFRASPRTNSQSKTDAEKPQKENEFAEFATNSHSIAEKNEKESVSVVGEAATEDDEAENSIHFSPRGCEFGEFVREAAPAKDRPIRKDCELVANSANSYLHVTKKAQIPQVLASLNGAPSIALDTETSGDKLRLIQLCDGSNPPVILDVPAQDIKAVLVEFLRDKDLIIQASRFDSRVLKDAVGLEISIARVFDTYIASAVLTNTKVTEELKKRRRRNWHPNSLESIAQRTLGIVLDKTFQKADWSVDLSLPENEPMLSYAAADVKHSHAIRLHLEADLEGQNLRPVYELERDLVPCVNAMSEAGVYVDMDEVNRLGAEAIASAAEREVKVLALLGRKINVRSRKAQLLPALQELGITCKGEKLTTTDKKVLPLVDQKDHPAIGAILEWSEVNEEAKQLAQWPRHADSENIVRPQISQLGTVTGRFTYSAPNLQQVKKSALRSIIIAPPGYLILRADFKTIELILAAVRYRETAILEQVAAGVDLHTLTAMVLFHCAVKDVSKAQREMAKTTNFSLLYGRSLETYISACRLAGINDDVEELERIYRAFDQAWPNWAAYKADVTMQIVWRTCPREVRSMYGRRIILDPSLSNREMRGALLNFPIQASGSDELKLTMVNVWQEKPKGFRLLASIHDEILAIVKPNQVERAKALLREAAADAARRVMRNDIPIPLEIGVGKNWWEAIQDKEEGK
jgi:DNA polymerase I-like protein with 3'-5' exonuclease and polymerase domains